MCLGYARYQNLAGSFTFDTQVYRSGSKLLVPEKPLLHLGLDFFRCYGILTNAVILVMGSVH